MLPFLPTPYPDELFYSICARYHVWSGNKSFQATRIDLFGTKLASSIIDLPTRLNDLFARLPEGTLNTPDKIIKDNTLLPYYSPFMSSDRAESIKNAMLFNHSNKNKIHYKSEIVGRQVKPPPYLKICSECIKEDITRFEETYWRRIHQVTGVYVCSIHHCSLYETDIGFYSGKNNKIYVPLNQDFIKFSNPILLPGDVSKYYILAAEIDWLLKNSIPILGLDELKRRYIYYLEKKGLVTTSGQVRQVELINELETFFGKDFLSFLNCELTGKRNDWLRNIMMEIKVHPLCHILLIIYLGICIKDFFANKVHTKPPFGKGPWVCLNVASNHYLQPVIKNMQIKSSSKSVDPIGIFKCTCGFTYTKRGFNKNAKEKYKFNSVINYGEIWESRLIELKNLGKTYKEIGEILNISPKTAYNHLIKINQDRNMNVQMHLNESEEKKLKYREDWLNVQTKFPSSNKTQLKQIAPALFAWLYRNDRQWFDQNSPTITQRKNLKESRKDWKQIDKILSTEVLKVVKEELSSDIKPIRITKSRISKLINKHSLIANSGKKLPLTIITLDSLAETVEQFRVRRVMWALQELRKQGEEIKRSNVILKAGVNNNLSKKISELIDKEIYDNNR